VVDGANAARALFRYRGVVACRGFAILGSVKIVAVLPKSSRRLKAAIFRRLSPKPNRRIQTQCTGILNTKARRSAVAAATPGKGTGGVPTAGGTPEQYQAHILTPSAQASPDKAAEVIGVMSDAATVIARPVDGPSGVGLTEMTGVGEATSVATTGVKGRAGI